MVLKTMTAVIQNVIVGAESVWIQFCLEGKYFPVHHEFYVGVLSDITKLMFLLKHTKAGNVTELSGKQVRVIDTGDSYDSLRAIGSVSKNQFIDLYGGEFPVSEKKIYRRYEHTREGLKKKLTKS